MKKIAFFTLGLLLTSSVFVSCGASKSGCGLTSDADKIEQTTTTVENPSIEG